MNQRVVRLLLATYPPSFRQRYGAELEALTSDVGASRGVVWDIVRGSARAWATPRAHGGVIERRRWRLEATMRTVSIAWGIALVGMAGFSRGVDDSPLPGLSRPVSGAAFSFSESAFSLAAGVVAVGLLLYGLIILVPAARHRHGTVLAPVAVPSVAAALWLGISVGLGWVLQRWGGDASLHGTALVLGVGTALFTWAAIGGGIGVACAAGCGVALQRAHLNAHRLLPGSVGVVAISVATSLATAAAAVCLVALAVGGTVGSGDLVMPALGVALMVPASAVCLVSSARSLPALAAGVRRPS